MAVESFSFYKFIIIVDNKAKIKESRTSIVQKIIYLFSTRLDCTSNINVPSVMTGSVD